MRKNTVWISYQEIRHLENDFKAGAADARTADTLNLHPNEAGTKNTFLLMMC